MNFPPQQQAFRTKICRHYQQGRCTFGDACQFSHDTPEPILQNNVPPPRGQKRKAPVEDPIVKQTRESQISEFYPQPIIGQDGAIQPFFKREKAFAIMKAHQRGDPIFQDPKIDYDYSQNTGSDVGYSNPLGYQDASTVATNDKKVEQKKLKNPKRKCKWFQVGKCTYGDQCGFLHELGELTAQDISSTKELFMKRINPNMKVNVHQTKNSLLGKKSLLGECPPGLNPEYKHLGVHQLIEKIEIMKETIKETTKILDQKKILDLAKNDEDIRIVDDIFKFNYDQNFVQLLRYRNNEVLKIPKRSSSPVQKRRKRRSRSKSPLKSSSKKRRKSQNSSEYKSRVKIICSSRKRVEDEMEKLSKITHDHLLEEKAAQQLQALKYKEEQEELWKKEQAERVYTSMKRDIEQEIAGMMAEEMEKAENTEDQTTQQTYGEDDEFFRNDDPMIPDKGLDHQQNPNTSYYQKYADYSYSYGPQ